MNVYDKFYSLVNDNEKFYNKYFNKFMGEYLFHDLPKCFQEKIDFIKILKWFNSNQEAGINNSIKSFFNLEKKWKESNQDLIFKNYYNEGSYNCNKRTVPSFFNINKKNNFQNLREISIPNFHIYFLSLIFFLGLEDFFVLVLDDEKNHFFHFLEQNGKKRILFLKYQEKITGDNEFLEKINDYFGWDKNNPNKILKLGSYKRNKLYESEIASYKRFCLKLDIKDFFNSIYSHVFDQPEIRAYLKEKASKKWSNDEIDAITKRIDCICMWNNSNQTNKLITGPYFSSLVSNIILAYIDNKLIKLDYKNDFTFSHYMDDYSFYTDSLDTIDKLEKDFSQIIRKLNLEVNFDKTKKLTYPFNNKNQKDITFRLLSEELRNNCINIHLVDYIMNFLDKKISEEYGISYYIPYIFKNLKFSDDECCNILIVYLLNLFYIIPSASKNIYESIINIIKSNTNDETIKFLISKTVEGIEKVDDYNSLSSIYLFFLFFDMYKYLENKEKFYCLLNEKIKPLVKSTLISPFSYSIILSFFRINNQVLVEDDIKDFVLCILKKIKSQDSYKNYQGKFYTIWSYTLIELLKLCNKLNFYELDNDRDFIDLKKSLKENIFFDFLVKKIDFILW